MIYQSKQSYYDMLKEAGLSWHQNPNDKRRADEDKVMLKREEIKKKLEEQQAEIIAGEVVVFAEDECHLLSDDTTGYVWGRRNQKNLRFQ
ncbi:MAG: hypothetical protein IPL99_00005 [Candidatus Competibacteraceae bacterium]|nr:hypothetical protein [Candidatus Competibacteraceae bacterium]